MRSLLRGKKNLDSVSSEIRYSPDALRKVLTIGAILLALSGYALPWYKVGLSAYVVGIQASFYIWGINAGGYVFLGQSRSFTATWFNLPSEIASDIMMEGGVGLAAAFVLYVLASAFLLSSLSGSRSSTITSVVLLLSAILSYVGTISYLNAQPGYILVQQDYTEGLSVAIIATLLSGGAAAIPFLKESTLSVRYPLKIYCPNCGRRIPVNSTFCTFCGEKTEIQRTETSGIRELDEPTDNHRPAGIEDLPKKEDWRAKQAQEAIDRARLYIKKNRRPWLQLTEAEKTLAEAEKECAERNYEKALDKASRAEYSVDHAIFEHQREHEKANSSSTEGAEDTAAS